MTTRLIEKWLPIAALGEESVRERRSMTALPPVYYLHVWWARRPLVAARAAVLASLLPADADREKFLHMLGIHGDPVAAQARIAKATREGVRLGADAYGYPRAFSWLPSVEDRDWLNRECSRIGLKNPILLDPTAGGGSIPCEAVRLGLSTFGNDLNPVAALILKATVEWPVRVGKDILGRLAELSPEFVKRLRTRIAWAFPDEPDRETKPDGYLWARTVVCPYCDGLVPLSPNWRLAPNGTGIRLIPDRHKKLCRFEVVRTVKEQSGATVADGDAKCPYPDCERLIDGVEVKKQAQDGKMGEQLYAVVFKRLAKKEGNRVSKRQTWIRDYRAPRPEDDNSELVNARLAERLPEWQALDVIPSEAIGDPSNYDRGHRMYGMTHWRDLFSPRQLLGHVTAVEVFREMLAERESAGTLDDPARAAFALIGFSIDKLLNWNARLSSWNVNYERVRSVFDTHGFKMVWSFAEMVPLVDGLGPDWAIDQTTKAYRELLELFGEKNTERSTQGLLFTPQRNHTDVQISCKSADNLDHLTQGSVDLIVMDPPYYDNVMYGELSDFFYVWLKRTAGLVFPEFFRRRLTDKDNEAVANVAKFSDQKSSRELAANDYRQRMQYIFSECRRVLKPDGLLTLMFTHKAAGAWDALTSGLLEGGFTITATWPVNTEFDNGLGIRSKAAANSTIFLVCRPRPARQSDEAVYWEDVEPRVASAVRRRIEEFEKAGIKGVDLYLSCFGPALEEFAKHWPLKRGQPRAEAPKAGRRKKADDGTPFDPYSVTPEDALDAARREVKKWKLDKLLRTHRKAELDPLTEWFVLAWDAFKAPEFPYDEALRLARVVGIDLDHDVLGKVAEKKASDVILWDSAKRAAKAALGPTDGSRALIDALHHAAHRGRTQGVEAARELLGKSGADHKPGFPAALAAVLEVLPVSSTFTHVADEAGPVAEAASDFDALEHLRRLAYSEKVARPQQLEMWSDTPQ